MCLFVRVFCIFVLDDTSYSEVYPYGHTLSLRDALPSCARLVRRPVAARFARQRPVVRWRGSRSNAATRAPLAASAIATWAAVVDLPVPLFSFANTMMCVFSLPSDKACQRSMLLEPLAPHRWRA